MKPVESHCAARSSMSSDAMSCGRAFTSTVSLRITTKAATTRVRSTVVVLAGMRSDMVVGPLLSAGLIGDDATRR